MKYEESSWKLFEWDNWSSENNFQRNDEAIRQFWEFYSSLQE